MNYAFKHPFKRKKSVTLEQHLWSCFAELLQLLRTDWGSSPVS